MGAGEVAVSEAKQSLLLVVEKRGTPAHFAELPLQVVAELAVHPASLGAGAAIGSLAAERRPLGGDKNLVGGPGNDGVQGGEGTDNVLGGSGNDSADGGPGADNILGGDGNDVIDPFNKPARQDVVTCGGFDRVLADRADVVVPDCERVAVGPAAAQRLNHRIEESGFYDRIFEGLALFPGG